ncbi:hypothetical protein [Flavipsychrobacter stenotrophus]|nr:hypothetical protein [Flavipsychrobacter stenotrophus]
MKGFFLTAALFLGLTGGAFAQTNVWNDYGVDRTWDIGFNYGASTITRPNGPEKFYQGSRTNVVPDFSIKLQYVVTPHWHLAFDLGWRTWESYGTWSNPYTYGTQLSPTEVKFQLGKPAITETFQLNYVIPYYSKYKVLNRANLYFGVSAGLVTTVSDGSQSFGKYNNRPDSSYRYVNGYNYGMGIGYSVGVQMGYTYYFLRKWGVNVELAARYVNMTASKENGLADAHGTTKYNMLFFPQTFGIRYRFR